jgi:hypothetical protein
MLCLRAPRTYTYTAPTAAAAPPARVEASG